MRKYLTFIILVIILFAESNAQEYWQTITPPDSVIVYSLEPNLTGDLFIGGAWGPFGGVYKTSNDGVDWEFMGIENESIFSFQVNEFGHIYAGSRDLHISIDNGLSWTMIYDGFQNMIGLEYLEGGIIFATGGPGSYTSSIKSVDYGESWDEVIIYPSNSEYAKDYCIQNADTVYIGTTGYTGGGGVYKTIDGGENWEHIGLSEYYVSCIEMNSSGDLYAGARGNNLSGNGGLFLLPNGEQEWIELLNWELVTSMVINQEDVIYVGISSVGGYDCGVLCSFDNGYNWEDISSEEMYGVEDLTIDNQGYLYARSEWVSSKIFKSLNTTITGDYDHKVEQNTKLLNSPNPFSSSTTISYSVPNVTPTTVKIKIHNSKGNIIETFEDNEYSGGTKSFTFEPKKLPAGIYYIELIAGSYHAFNKMVLQK